MSSFGDDLIQYDLKIILSSFAHFAAKYRLQFG